jgi:hypothetical protein
MIDMQCSTADPQLSSKVQKLAVCQAVHNIQMIIATHTALIKNMIRMSSVTSNSSTCNCNTHQAIQQQLPLYKVLHLITQDVRHGAAAVALGC